MAQKKVNLSFQFIEPAEHVLETARSFLDSPMEDRRCVAKALLDVTTAGLAIKKAMEENRNAQLEPYLDFWFADAIVGRPWRTGGSAQARSHI